MKSIVIFGGAGFVGKHILLKISKLGYKIIVPYQKQTNEAKLKLLGSTGQIIPYHFSSLDEKRLKSIIEKSEICINLKTAWDTKKHSYSKSIFDFNVKLISILNNCNTPKKLIFFSGLGVDQGTDSLRDRAILDVENHIKTNLRDSIIIRPSVILGGGDQFLRSLIPLFKLSYFIPLFGNGSKKFQPVHIEDICNFIYFAVKTSFKSNNTFELGGPNIFTYKEFYNLIAENIGKKKVFLPIPMRIAKILIGIAEKTPFSPINLEQLSLFENDNILQGTKMSFDYYEMKPQSVLSSIKKYI
ncbi:MAG: hypothetical protein CFH15_01061 [Alphaproteobacteria bacterium MarineAlpha5_Bin5]|nr:MAG: hypothetical protein CFH14_01238 [Alphaproteobacteria bacterium MarineAlpha5_Bin4]PPR49644.1 MAG: hypothetical protein CFH15_01061 [Alphaproteobacteria bacterium MarineAlpha5_Bin5]